MTSRSEFHTRNYSRLGPKIGDEDVKKVSYRGEQDDM